MNFKIISNLKEAEEAWKTLSPNEVIYDDWDFRYTYYKHFNYPLYFYAAYDDEKLVALLPLMLNTDTKFLDFFAGFGYMEDNRMFHAKGYENLIHELLHQIKIPAKLEYMHESMAVIENSKIHDYNYFIDLGGFTDYLSFIDKYLTGHRRRDQKSKIRKLLETNQIEIIKSDVEDLEILEKWNRVRFGNQSSFNERPFWNLFFKEIASKFNSEIITAVVNGKKEGVGLILYFKDICIGINTGYNIEISNLGKYVTLMMIDSAIKSNKKIYDAGGSGAFGWKEDFKLLKRPFYSVEINNE